MYQMLKPQMFASSFLFYCFLSEGILALYFFLFNNTIILEWDVLQVQTATMSMMVVFDWVTMSFSSVVCFISACVMLFSNSYMSEEKFLSRFVWLVMLFVLSMNFLIFIPSLVGLLLGWDGLGIVSFALVIYYNNPKSLGAGLMTAFMNRVGDVALLLCIGWCISLGHWASNSFWLNSSSYLVCFCLLIAGMTKSAQIPFSSWLPAAMAAPTPVSALVHSSTLVTAGVFILIRFYSFLSAFKWFSSFLLVVAMITMVLAGLTANFESDLKKIIALSTLSQLGVMMTSIATGFPLLALFHLYVHALFKALLFICAGSIIHSHYNYQDIRKMGQLWKQMPLSTSCLNVANLALCGAPFMAGFYSKDVIIESMIMGPSNSVALFMMLLATFLTVSYSVRLSVCSLWGKMKQISINNINDEDKYLYYPAIFLTVGAIMGGASMSWLFMMPMSLNFFSSKEKLLPLVVMIMGGSVPLLFEFKVSLLLNHFMSSMWFLTMLSNNLVSKPVLTLSYSFYQVLDSGWVEKMSGGGLFKMLKYFISINTRAQSSVFSWVFMGSGAFVMTLLLYLCLMM
uniref:NADH-ubiquinone oxidoreductase chain 5 n=1 Tax=Nierstraszella lineata TaxID=515354 RepID=A0A6H1PGR4_9MOLL|nr:NADH dehydrogenase subunit 5 [Nierstraszella lineata]QIZ12582.1 NADH dehydrogenase subunit 5 [Nierstraszella lineata]